MLEYKLGWRRDLPDFRDLSNESQNIGLVINQLKVPTSNNGIDLRQWCSPIEDQGQIGSCTSQAGVSLIEYYERRAFGKHIDASRLFLYKTTRNLMGETGDTGAYLRDTMKAMVLFGLPPEAYWPYDITKFDAEPTAFCYAFADNYKALMYYRLDTIGITPQNLLTLLKQKLMQGLPFMFGFSVFSSISSSSMIPYPQRGEKLLGGHAISCVGFNDSVKIGNYTGALLIRNSWGTTWGDKGYGWLPYQYVLSGLACDFWSLVKANYVDTDLFK